VLGGLLFGVNDSGLRFPVLNAGVYKSIVDGEVGGWELVKFVL
jgi:hypothetical protein